MDETSAGRVKFLDEHMENYNIEHSALHRKLQSKVEALKIMRKELERFRTERDQFKLMAETLQMRYTAIKKSLHSSDSGSVEYMERSSVAALVNDLREKNTSLATDLECLRQSLSEKEGDIRVLREMRCQLCEKCQRDRFSGQEDSSQIAWNEEKSRFIAQLEELKKKNAQLKYDFRALLDEKEEVVTERDAFKCKVHRLNHELSIALKGGESQVKVLDIDSLVRENKYLQERLKNVENELELVQHSLNKYKTMLEMKRNKKGVVKLGSSNSDMIMSHKQVKVLLERGTDAELPNKAATIADLKSLCLALLDNVNDKSLALTHQKKANKILALRISELEQRLGQSSWTASPSEVLLNGYSASNVDKDLEGVASSANASASTGSVSNDESEEEENSSASERESVVDCEEKLEDLPPELAQLVEKALREHESSAESQLEAEMQLN
ncbi:coiled-coil domain-containing protein 149 [Phlebotomus argentipes]|uniref:coiled-coil domain-containing protein 149 n=1 Tax=Phlebotomus argentipes TaxID=94469 RepID=UPI0028933A51|nr:coiled-coil domain-containing protein 149 [Phlebotomus argentipes]